MKRTFRKLSPLIAPLAAISARADVLVPNVIPENPKRPKNNLVRERLLYQLRDSLPLIAACALIVLLLIFTALLVRHFTRKK